MLLVILVILHALLSILWLGLSLRLQVQAGLAADSSVPRGVWIAGDRTVQMMTVLAILFYAVAVGAFFYGGGFSLYGPTYHTSLLLGLALVLVQVLMLQPAWAKLAAGDLAARKKVSMALGIAHALWLVVFVLMFFGPRWGSVWGF
jgi:hypothetical protein